MTELRALTGARGLAAWFVVLYHLRFSLGVPDAVLRVLAKGYFSVDFFFLLSGFVIWLSYADRIGTQRWASIPSFLLRRVARIWPLHLVLLGFALVIVLALAVTGRPADPQYPLDMLPLHALLLQCWPVAREAFGVAALQWNDPAWSISCEMAAYLAFPLLPLAIDLKRTPTIVLLMAIAGSFSILAYVMLSREAHELGDGIPYFGMVRCLTQFAAGAALGALWLRFRDKRTPALGVALVVSAAAFVSFGTGLLGEIAIIPTALAGLLFAIALTANHPANPLGWRVVHYLGEISFATYLSHSLLWKAYRMAFVGDPAHVAPPIMAVFLALVLAASITLYHGVERPAQRWINRLPSRRRERLGESIA